MLTSNNENYIHSKTGKRYRKLCEARNSENPDEIMVVYAALYGNGDIWVRPKSMFYEDVEIDGKMVPRFKKEDDND